MKRRGFLRAGVALSGMGAISGLQLLAGCRGIGVAERTLLDLSLLIIVKGTLLGMLNGDWSLYLKHALLSARNSQTSNLTIGNAICAIITTGHIRFPCRCR